MPQTQVPADLPLQRAPTLSTRLHCQHANNKNKSKKRHKIHTTPASARKCLCHPVSSLSCADHYLSHQPQVVCTHAEFTPSSTSKTKSSNDRKRQVKYQRFSPVTCTRTRHDHQNIQSRPPPCLSQSGTCARPVLVSPPVFLSHTLSLLFSPLPCLRSGAFHASPASDNHINTSNSRRQVKRSKPISTVSEFCSLRHHSRQQPLQFSPSSFRLCQRPPINGPNPGQGYQHIANHQQHQSNSQSTTLHVLAVKLTH